MLDFPIHRRDLHTTSSRMQERINKDAPPFAHEWRGLADTIAKILEDPGVKDGVDQDAIDFLYAILKTLQGDDDPYADMRLTLKQLLHEVRLHVWLPLVARGSSNVIKNDWLNAYAQGLCSSINRAASPKEPKKYGDFVLHHGGRS